MKGIYKTYVSELQDRIVAFYGNRLVSLVIFGSVAKGTATPESDIDVLVIAERLHPRKMKRIEEFIDNVEDKLENVPLYVSPVIKTPEEASAGSPLFFDMVYDNAVLFDRKGFFQGIVDRLRRRFDELGSRRVFRGNRWYWILKPGSQPGEGIRIF